MAITRSYSNLLTGTLLAAITAVLIYVVQLQTLVEGLMQVVIVIAGMTAMAAIASFAQHVERSKPFIQITFNEVLLRQALSAEQPEYGAEVVEAEWEEQQALPPWELSAAQLVGVDNPLALARLRIDLEKELRRIAYEHRINIQNRPLGVGGLAEELVQREVMPSSVLVALRDIMSVCNKAVHGEGDVTDDVAASVVRVGSQLLDQLKRESVSR